MHKSTANGLLALRSNASKAKALAVGAVASVLSFSASAGALATAVTGEVDTAELLLIGGIVMTVAGIIMFIRSGKKVAN